MEAAVLKGSCEAEGVSSWWSHSQKVKLVPIKWKSAAALVQQWLNVDI